MEDQILRNDESSLEYEINQKSVRAEPIRLRLFEEVDEGTKKYEFVGETKGPSSSTLSFIMDLASKRYLLMAEGVDNSKNEFLMSCHSTQRLVLRSDGWI